MKNFIFISLFVFLLLVCPSCSKCPPCVSQTDEVGQDVVAEVLNLDEEAAAEPNE